MPYIIQFWLKRYRVLLALAALQRHDRMGPTVVADAQSIIQSKVLTKPHTGKGEATSQHHHRGQQTLHHEVMQARGAVNESRQH